MTFSSFLYHLLGGMRKSYTNIDVVALEQTFLPAEWLISGTVSVSLFY